MSDSKTLPSVPASAASAAASAATSTTTSTVAKGFLGLDVHGNSFLYGLVRAKTSATTTNTIQKSKL
jgi:hypothetical protein